MDVLDRLLSCSLQPLDAIAVVRITGMSALASGSWTRRVGFKAAASITHPTQPATYPDGLDTEVFSYEL